MLTVAETLKVILDHAPALPAEKTPLADALDRVLRDEAKAETDLPPDDRSTRDGYAIRGDDLSEAYTQIGSIQPGETPAFALQPGQCARIFTGAVLPQGATRVIRQEDVEITPDGVRVTQRLPDAWVRVRGEDAKAGDTLIAAGQLLRPAHLGILAGLGITHPLVSSSPRVAHLVSGNEIVDPSVKPEHGQLRDSNSSLIAGLCAGAGARVTHHQYVTDDAALTNKAVAALSENDCDVLLFSGGASVGDFDFCRPALEKAGYAIHFHGVNVRPGRPLIFGTRGKQIAFGIPGNPVSHFVVFHLFIRPALLAMQGATAEDRRMEGILSADFPEPSNPRETYWPARWSLDDGRASIRALPWNSSGHLGALTPANALLIIPPKTPALGKGDRAAWITV